MNANTIENFEIADKDIISTSATIQFMCMLYLATYYIMIYSCILMINYMRTAAYFNKKVEEEVRSSNEVEEEEPVASLEEDMETLYVYDFEGTGEQLRRLRAYNPILSDETDDEYASRIWSMAYQEDEEEAQKAANLQVENEIVAEVVNSSTNEIVAEVANSSANEIVAVEEKDVNTWRTSEDGLTRYKGEWKNGLPNGKGIKHFYKTDSYIDGNFVDGFAEGYGKQTFEQTWERTQPYYAGEFKRNTYNGQGAYYYGDGDYYKGMWKDGKYHGQGAAYSLRLDRTWVGEYENDVKGEGNWVRGEI